MALIVQFVSSVIFALSVANQQPFQGSLRQHGSIVVIQDPAGTRTLPVYGEQIGSRLNLPVDFVRRTGHRLTFDQYAQRYHAVAGNAALRGRPPGARQPADAGFVKTLSPQIPDPISKYRIAQERRQLPLRGFRAPILDEAGRVVPMVLPAEGLTEAQRKAADFIARRLAHEGLIATLVEALAILGPQKVLAQPAEVAARELSDLGFPSDWLDCFKLNGPQSARGTELIRHTARRLLDGKPAAAVKEELKSLIKLRISSERPWISRRGGKRRG